MEISKLDKTSETSCSECGTRPGCGSSSPCALNIWQHYEVSHVHYSTPHSKPMKLIVGEFRATIKNFNEIVFEPVESK
jgi:hypothetical protein